MRLRLAVTDVIERHEVLRTVFPSASGQPHQLVCDASEFDERGVWRIVGSEQELYDTLVTGFDVTIEWPLRARLFSVSDTEFVFAVVAHHIGADGESMLRWSLTSSPPIAFAHKVIHRSGRRCRCSSPTTPSGSIRHWDRRMTPTR